MAEQVTGQRPIILSVNAIINGQFFAAGDPLPFKGETDLPQSLKAFVATGEEASTQPVERNIYDLPLAARRQVRKLELAAAEKEWAEAQASEPLPPETAAALAASHDIAIGRARAQLEHNQTIVDAAYEAAQPVRPAQFYVRRGGAWGKTQNSKLKPGETVFVKRENGEMEAVGVFDSRGEPPPPEIQL